MVSLKQRDTINLDCCGGLGNQMFMYAAGIYYGKRFGKRLDIVKPPISRQRYGSYARPFQLTAFNIREHVREADVVDRLCFSRNPKVRTIKSLVAKCLNCEIISEPAEHQFHADLHRESTNTGLFLSGYWQAFGYVTAIEPELRERFVLQSVVERRTQEFADLILFGKDVRFLCICGWEITRKFSTRPGRMERK